MIRNPSFPSPASRGASDARARSCNHEVEMLRLPRGSQPRQPLELTQTGSCRRVSPLRGTPPRKVRAAGAPPVRRQVHWSRERRLRGGAGMPLPAPPAGKNLRQLQPRSASVLIDWSANARRGSRCLGESGRLGRRGLVLRVEQPTSRLRTLLVEPQQAYRAAGEPKHLLARLAGAINQNPCDEVLVPKRTPNSECRPCLNSEFGDATNSK
jgi:hypothetical protein